MDETIEERIKAFQAELPSQAAVDLVRRHVIFGECFILQPNDYFRLRSEIAKQFSTHPNEVLVVGSGKLGFSISPKKRYRPFCDESDIDAVIISTALFDNVWREAYHYWRDGGYWEQQETFRKYLFQGWVRPDQLPSEGRFQFSREWWEFFRALTSGGGFGPYKIRGALYRDWDFLESYQCVGVKSCQVALTGAQ
jgi:hypothetical protein